MRLLDLFCGAGGCSVGYHRAGFTDIVGVDNRPMPRYPFTFVQADALEYLARHGHEFDAIHASPPCQAYSIARNNGAVKKVPKLVGKVRQLLEKSHRHWVIENVPGSPLGFSAVLCGASFGLGVCGFDLARHRVFEASVFLMTQPCQHRRGKTIGVYGNGTNSFHRKLFGRCVSVDELRQAMGIDWMVRKELSQAIPPAYTEFIGRQLLDVLREA